MKKIGLLMMLGCFSLLLSAAVYKVPEKRALEKGCGFSPVGSYWSIRSMV